MSISSINYGSSILGQSDLSTELSTGVKSTNYAGMGIDEGFAVAARAQLANISAYGDTMTNVTTIIDAGNAALQSLSSTVSEVQGDASASPQNLTSTGQTIGQQTAASQLSSMIGMLNTQVGDRYIFSGTAISTPAVTSADDILNGSGTQAGLKQVIAERLQADLGSGSPSTGRLVLSAPATVPITLSEDVAGSVFGLKLGSVSSSNASGSSPPDIAVTGPSGSPAAITVNLASNPNPGDQVTFNFNLPDGTTQSVTLTATNTTPPPSGSFAIGTSATATSGNLNAALNSAISNIANTSLVAASAVAAGNDFFNTTTVVGNPVNNKAATPITAATVLSGASGNSLTTGFSAGDTITVNGQTIAFVASGASGNNQVNVTDTVQQLITKIDALTGTSTPSTVTNGIVTLNGNSGSPSLTVSSSNTAAFAALGFPGGTATAGPLRVSGSPLSSAISLTNGSANTVEWYTGNSGPGTARSSATVQVDNSQTVQFGAQANEQAIRNALQQIAVYAAVVVNPPGGTNAGAQASALSQRIADNLTPQPGQQAISDIQTDFATAQNTMKDVQARQTQSQTALQNLISDTEGISQDQVASEIQALQTSLQASYQTTAMLSQLSLVKFLPLA